MNTVDSVLLDGNVYHQNEEDNCARTNSRKDLALIHRLGVSEQLKSDSFISEAMSVTPKALITHQSDVMLFLRLLNNLSFDESLVVRSVQGKVRESEWWEQRSLRSRCVELGWDDDDFIFPTSEGMKGRVRTFSANDAL